MKTLIVALLLTVTGALAVALSTDAPCGCKAEKCPCDPCRCVVAK